MVEKRDLDKLSEYTVNTKWLLENMEELRARLPDRYVAVCDSGRKIMDASALDELLDKLSKAGKQRDVCAIEFINREEYALIV
jgi:hypothetical protein